MIPFEYQDTAGMPGGSPLLDRLLSRIRNTLQSLKNVVTNDRLVRVTFAALTDTPVRHGLNAPVRTWEVVDRNADANVWQSTALNERPRDEIILQASAPVTALLRFT